MGRYSKLKKKWLEVLKKGEKECPICGSSNLREGYEVSKVDKDYGWGGIWCEECRNGLWISRVILINEEVRRKIVTELPKDLNLI